MGGICCKSESIDFTQESKWLLQLFYLLFVNDININNKYLLNSWVVPLSTSTVCW